MFQRWDVLHGSSARSASLFLALIATTWNFFLAWPSCCAGQRSDVMPQSEFLDLYRQTVAKLESRYKNIEAQGVVKDAYVKLRAERPAARAPRILEFNYMCSNDQEKLEFQSGSSDPSDYFDRVIIDDGSREFWVRRDSPDRPYYLESAPTNHDNPKWYLKSFRYRVKAAPYCPAGFAYYLEGLSSTEFSVSDVKESVDDETKLVQFNCEYAPSDRKKPRFHGSISLDALADWVVRDFKLVVESVERKRGEHMVQRWSGSVRYRMDEGVALPASISLNETLEGHYSSIETYELEYCKLKTNHPKEFALAAYGLEDFGANTRRTTGLYPFYALTLGTAVLSIGLILSRVATMLRKKQDDHGTRRVSDTG